MPRSVPVYNVFIFALQQMQYSALRRAFQNTDKSQGVSLH